MELESNHNSSVLTDPTPTSKSRLDIHSSLYSPPNVVFSLGLLLKIRTEKPLTIDDVRSNSWLDAMKSSSPTHRKKAKDFASELVLTDTDVAYRNWMVILPLCLGFKYFSLYEILDLFFDDLFRCCSLHIHQHLHLLSG